MVDPKSGRRQVQRLAIWLAAVVLMSAVAGGAWYAGHRWRSAAPESQAAPTHASEDHDHAPDHDHDHHEADGHDHHHDDVVEFGPAALKSIGFKAATVALQPFVRTQTMPGIVVERPGKTQFHVTAPFTGVLTKLFVGHGEAIAPGSPVCEVRLTHEELVAAQQGFLQTAESLDVVNREIARLAALTDGVVAGRRVIEQQYEKQKLEASLRAAEQALLLHGLTEEQVAEILRDRKLLRTFTIQAPEVVHAEQHTPQQHVYHVQRLSASLGQQVEAGQELAVLADHCELSIEGRAFEDDAESLRQAARDGLPIAARLLTEGSSSSAINDLRILYLADQVDQESRALHFYLPLKNEIVLDQTTPDGRRFIEWRFKPGQRMELLAPVERWDEQIVLPREAVVEDGVEHFVYRRHGKGFERVPVHVQHRDARASVIARDGDLKPGDVIAGAGAFQMHLQTKNQSGGGDPHAGHTH